MPTLRRLLRRRLLLLLLQGRIRVAILGSAISLRRLRVTLLLDRVSAAVGDRRIDILLAHGISALLRRTAILRRSSIATAAPVAAAVATTSTKASATAGTVVRGLVDSDRSAVKLDVVHGGDGTLGIRILAVSHKSKAAASASISILDHDCFFDSAELFKLLAQSRLLGVPCEATNKELSH